MTYKSIFFNMIKRSILLKIPKNSFLKTHIHTHTHTLSIRNSILMYTQFHYTEFNVRRHRFTYFFPRVLTTDWQWIVWNEVRMILRLSHISNNLYLPIDATQIPPSAIDNGPQIPIWGTSSNQRECSNSSSSVISCS